MLRFEPGFRGLNTTIDGATIQGVPTDAGMILTFAGRCAPEKVAIDTQTQEILTEAQAQIREDTFSTEYPRYNLWQFRIKELVRTDGPQRLARLAEAAEEQRARAEEETFGKMGAFFERLLKMIEAKGGTVTPEAATVTVAAEKANREATKAAMNPDQQAALEDWEKEEADVKKNLKSIRDSLTAPAQEIDVRMASQRKK